MQGARLMSRAKGHPFTERSVLGGCSGVFYALPLFLVPQLSSMESLYLVLQAALSVGSDYIYVFDESIVHVLDRIVAHIGMAYYLYFAFTVGGIVRGWVPAVALFLCGSYLRKNGKQALYNHVHFLWHLWGGLAVVALHQKWMSAGGGGEDAAAHVAAAAAAAAAANSSTHM